MQAVNNTGQSGVLVLKIDEDDVNTVLLNTDVNSDGSFHYAYDNFANVFSENILEYAFAYAEIPRDQITKKQREAAQSLLKIHEIDKLRHYLEHDIPEEEWDPTFLQWYEKKGVLGEIILHMILKEFKNTMLRFLFCTNTIIEGVNTSAKNVIYYDNKIGSGYCILKKCHIKKKNR